MWPSASGPVYWWRTTRPVADHTMQNIPCKAMLATPNTDWDLTGILSGWKVWDLQTQELGPPLKPHHKPRTICIDWDHQISKCHSISENLRKDFAFYVNLDSAYFKFPNQALSLYYFNKIKLLNFYLSYNCVLPYNWSLQREGIA